MDNKIDAQRDYCTRKKCFHKVPIACDGEDGLVLNVKYLNIIDCAVARERSGDEAHMNI